MQVEIYNPNNVGIETLPKIYGFNNGPAFGNDLSAQLIAEDGMPLGSHVCSYEGYMAYDLGIVKGSRPDRHKTFREYYPDGYIMEFVGSENIEEHEGLNKAFGLNKVLEQEYAENSEDQTNV